MHLPTQTKAKIYSAGTFLPPQIVKSEALLEDIQSETRYGIDHNWLGDKMGIHERRMAEADAKPSDLAIPAAQQALAKCPDLDLDQIDLVIFCGIERDQPEPATAHIIQSQLGLKARYAFDVANACFGFIDAMQVASNYIRCGITRYALIVTGEVPTKVLRAAVDMLKGGVDIKTARQIIGALSVGDAGGAVVMGPSETGETSGFELFNTITHSDQADKCRYNQRDDGSFEGHMKMGQLAGAFVKCHAKLMDDTLSQLGWSSFDWVLSHQIGQKPFDILTRINGVEPDKMIKTLDKLGNITSATFPVNFDQLLSRGNIESGARIGGCFAGSGIVIGQFGYTI